MAENKVEIALWVRDAGATAAIQSVQGALQGLMAQIGKLAAVAGAGLGFSSLVKTGIEFNSVMETSRSGMAALILANNQLVDTQGKVLGGSGAVTAAFRVASDVQKQLKEAAKTTAASYQDLVKAFQVAYGPATAAGVRSMSQVKDIVVTASQAVAALGLDSRQTGQEIRALLQGERGPDNMLANVLQITKEELTELKNRGEDVGAFFLGKLKPFADAAGASLTNFSTIVSNLGDTVDHALGEAVLPLFKEIKAQASSFGAGFGGMESGLGAIGQGMADALRALGPLLQAIAALSVSVVKLGTDFLAAFAPVVPVLTKVVEGLIGVIDKVGTVGVSLGAGALAFVKLGGAANAALYSMIGLSAAGDAAILKLIGTVSLATGGWVALGAAVAVALGYLVKWKYENEADEAWARAAAAQSTYIEVLQRRYKVQVEVGASDELLKLSLQERAAVMERVLKSDKDGVVTLQEVTEALSAMREETLRAAQASAEFTKKQKETKAAYLELLASLKAQVRIASLDGLKQKLAEVTEEFRKRWAEIKKTFFDEGTGQWAQSPGPLKALLADLEKLKRIEAVKEFAKNFKAELVSVGETATIELQKIPDKAKTYLTEAVEVAKESTRDIRQELTDWADILLKQGKGLEAGWALVMSRIPTYAESAARGVQEAWGALSTALESSFFAVLTGRFESFTDVVKGLGEDMAASFSKAFSDAIQRIIAGISTVGEEWTNLTQGPTSAGGAAVGVIGGAAMGYGMGAAMGSDSPGGGKNASIWGGVGGAIGSLYGPLGTMIGSLLGSLLGKALDADEFGDEFVKSFALNMPWEGGGSAGPVNKMRDEFVARMTDFFKLAAPSKEAAFDLRKELIKAISDSFGVYRVHAGDQGDFEKDIQKLLSTVLPLDLLRVAFGQTLHQKEFAGITREGAWATGDDLFDPNAPIPKLLSGLGVTIERIQQIAREIATGVDPEAIFQEIEGMVRVIIGFRDLGAALKQTVAEVWADMDEAAQQRPASGFREWADTLVGLTEDLSQYSGEEQRQRALELIKLGEEYLESQRQALLALKQLAEDLAASIQGLLAQMTTALMSPAERAARDRQTVFGQTDWGPTVVFDWQAKIFEATTPEEIAKIVGETLDAAKRLFDQMLEDLRTAQAARSEIGDLIDDINGGFETVSMNASTVAESWAAVRDLQQRAADAAALSGREQIDAIRAVGKDARTLWEANQALIQRLAAMARDITKSINQQIWEIDFGAKGPQDQATAIADRIAELRSKLATATDPGEVQALTSEIQGLVSRYLGLFDENDPNAQAARDWAKQQLQEIRDLAQQVIQGMTDALEQANDALVEMLEGLTPILDEAITGLEADIDRLRDVVASIEEAMRGELTDMGNEIVEAGKAFAAAMEEATRLFTGLNEALGGGAIDPTSGADGPGPGHGTDDETESLTGNLSRASGAAGDFAGAVQDAVAFIRGAIGAPTAARSSGVPSGRLAAATGGGMASYALSVAEARYRARGPAFGARLTGR